MTGSGAQQPVDRHVFLVGFMGAGKSTIGPLIARLLGLPFHDLDDLIGARTNKIVAKIFAESGEAEFRRLETEELDACEELNPSVIALGGGAFIKEENRRIIDRIGISVWLDCPVEVCLARVGGDASRPLLGSDDAMRRLFDLRRPVYQMARLMIDSGNGSPEEIASRVVDKLWA